MKSATLAPRKTDNVRLPAINIQYPISQLILSGKKHIETRTYPLPSRYKDKDIYLVETPGAVGNFKARICGIIRFSGSFQYKSSRSFYADAGKHFVTRDSEWRWTSKGKWGWTIDKIEVFQAPILSFSGRRGIVFTKDLCPQMP